MRRKTKNTCILLFIFILSYFLLGCSKEFKYNSEYKQIKTLMEKWERGVNEKDLELYLSVFDEEMSHSLRINLELHKTLQFYSTEKMTVMNVIKLTDDNIKGIEEIDAIKGTEYEIYYLYYIAKVKEGMDSKYNSNGENFRLCVITNLDGVWKISQLSSAPVGPFLKMNIDLGSRAEKDFLAKKN